MSNFESDTVQIERAALAGLLRDNDMIAEVMSFIKSEHFSERYHQNLYSAILAIYQEKGKVDDYLLITQLHALGLKELNGISTNDYVDLLRTASINTDLIIDYFQELVKFHTLRKTYQALLDCQKFIKKNKGLKVHEILPELEKQLQLAVTTEEASEDYVDIFGTLESSLKERAESGVAYCLSSGFELFDKWYGGFSLGSLSIISASAKTGKSTFLMNLGMNMIKIPRNNCKVLFLDSEMETISVQTRIASAITGVNEWEYRTGSFKNNKEYLYKSEEVWKRAKEYEGRFTHVYIGNKGINAIISCSKQWYAKNIKPGEAAVIILDYIKIGENDIAPEEKEWQAIGTKTDKLEKLSKALPRTTILSAVQTNREGDVSQSARIKWFVANAYNLQKKTEEDYNAYGRGFGTHKLIPIVTRFLGEDPSADNLVKVTTMDGKKQWRQNFINYDISNFNITERGSLEDMLRENEKLIKPREVQLEDPSF